MLDSFFSDTRGYELTLFFWPKKLTQNVIKIDVHYTLKMSENNEFITSSSAFLIEESKNFSKPFLNFKNTYELNHFLTQEVDEFYMDVNEYEGNFAIVPGIIFHREKWSSVIRKVLNELYIKEFYAQRMSSHLHLVLPVKDTKSKLVKI